MTAILPPGGDGLAAGAPTDWRELLEAMWRIRHFEDEIRNLFLTGALRAARTCARARRPSPSASAGLSARRHGDVHVPWSRAVLAMGAPLDKAFGEILGKAGGLCGGKGRLDAPHRPLGRGARFQRHRRRPPPNGGRRRPRPPVPRQRRGERGLLRRRRHQHRGISRELQPRRGLEAAGHIRHARTTTTASTARSPPPLRSSAWPIGPSSYGMPGRMSTATTSWPCET